MGQRACDPLQDIAEIGERVAVELATLDQGIGNRPNGGFGVRAGGHNAGFLTFEAVITYPFHPLAGQTVLVVGDYEHSGIHHLLIRQVPDWMFSQTASALAIVVDPRLPISQLVLRGWWIVS